MGEGESWLAGHQRLAEWSEAATRVPVLGSVWGRLVQRPKELVRFTKFALVGLSGMAVDFTVLNIVKRLLENAGFGVGWSIAAEPHQIQLAAANTVSFSIAVVNNFVWNRLWTFPESRERPIAGQLFQFTVVNVFGWAINTILLLLMDQFVFQHFVSERLSYNLAKAFAIGVVLFWNFGVNRIWTYRDID
jgi:putative flippase GtrA